MPKYPIVGQTPNGTIYRVTCLKCHRQFDIDYGHPECTENPELAEEEGQWDACPYCEQSYKFWPGVLQTFTP